MKWNVQSGRSFSHSLTIAELCDETLSSLSPCRERASQRTTRRKIRLVNTVGQILAGDITGAAAHCGGFVEVTAVNEAAHVELDVKFAALVEQVSQCLVARWIK